jgi:hypothetical protein
LIVFINRIFVGKGPSKPSNSPVRVLYGKIISRRYENSDFNHLLHDILRGKRCVISENALAMTTGWFTAAIVLLILCRLLETQLGLLSFKVVVQLVCPTSGTTYV